MKKRIVKKGDMICTDKCDFSKAGVCQIKGGPVLVEGKCSSKTVKK